MRLFYSVNILFLIACKNPRQSEPKEKLPAEVRIDTVFHRYVPDTSKFPSAIHWDNRYYLRTKAISSLLGLENIEKGIDGRELRLWQLSSWDEAQELYILKELPDSVRLYHYNFNVDLSSWDRPNWRKPNVKIAKIKKTALLLSLPEAEALHINNLWSYPSGSEAGAHNYGQINCGAVCTEVADKYRYKFGFFPCPENNLVKASILDSVAQLHAKLSAFKMHVD